MSPIAKTSGWPGSVMSGLTLIRPARSTSRPACSASFAASGEAATPAAQITVFAHGQAFELPSGSTPVDLAYELGPEKGDQCLAATINGRLAPLSSPLRDGDVVEIFAESDGHVEVEPNAPRGPRKEWLGFVKSSTAQLQINKYFDDKNEPGMSIADKVRLGRATIGLTLRKHDRGLASEVPLSLLAQAPAAGANGREVVSLDLSVYGEPLAGATVRAPFSLYSRDGGWGG